MALGIQCSYALFDMEGNKVPPEVVVKVGEAFEEILKEVSVLITIPSLYVMNEIVSLN